MCERVPACQGVGWRRRKLDGELTLSIQQGLVGTFWISFNGLFTRLSRIIVGIYEINKLFSHDPGWHDHCGRIFLTVQWGGRKVLFYPLIPFLFKFSVFSTGTSTFGSHCLSFLSTPAPNLPLLLCLFSERAVGVFPSCPLSSPSFQHC